MSDLEARIAEVLGAHRIGEILHTDKDYGHWKVACTACEWVTEHSDGAAEEHLAHVAAMLAPLIREVQAKVLTEFADAHRMPEPLFMDDGRAVTVGDLLREKAAQLRSNDG